MMANKHTLRGVFAMMEDGEKVRRSAWPSGHAIWFTHIIVRSGDNGGPIIFSNGYEATAWNPTHDDIIARDWEMVD